MNNKNIKVCRKILQLSKDSYTSIGDQFKNPNQFCIKLLVQRAIDIFESIIILTKHKKILESGSLLRILIENYCQMKYLHLEPNKCQDFLNYDTLVAKRLRERRIKTNPNNKKQIIKELQEMNRTCKIVEKVFPHFEKGWHQQGMEDLMDKVGLKNKYDLYWYLNHFIHCGPSAEKIYLSEIKNDENLYLLGSTDFFFMTLEVIDSVFSLNIDKEIEELHKELFNL
jgi:hypothetical protein